MAPHSRRRALIAAAAVVAVAAGTGGFVAYRNSHNGQAGVNLAAPAGPSPFAQLDPAPGKPVHDTVVDTRGATVTNDNVTVVVPPGAVPVGRNIHVRTSPVIGPYPGEMFGAPISVEHDAPLASIRGRATGPRRVDHVEVPSGSGESGLSRS